MFDLVSKNFNHFINTIDAVMIFLFDLDLTLLFYTFIFGIQEWLDVPRLGNMKKQSEIVIKEQHIGSLHSFESAEWKCKRENDFFYISKRKI